MSRWGFDASHGRNHITPEDPRIGSSKITSEAAVSAWQLSASTTEKDGDQAA